MAAPKRTGRPLKTHAPGSDAVVSVTMPAELKTKLQEHALAANRTLSQEILRRVERSFDVSALQADAIEVALHQAYLQMRHQVESQFEIATEMAEQLQAKIDENRRLLNSLSDDQKAALAEYEKQMQKRGSK